VTGEDLIARQLHVAGGHGIGLSQGDVHFDGHAIECRINAEDPFNNFMPAPGRITAWTPPSGEGIRLDTHARMGYLVPPFYDSMIGKLIAKGRDRSEAIERILKAIRDFRVEGLKTTLPLLSFVAAHKDFRENRITTRWLEDKALPDFARA
jgi:acetyl-CoA carboxylase biotin carboxylase subunit